MKEMVSRTIALDDDVIIYANYKQCYLIKVTKGQTFQSRFGALTHDDLIGRRFGTKVQCSKGYVYVLRSTPELYTSVLRHRTQILYPHDISLIVCQLEVKSGSILLEAGTGSGAFTRAAARLLAPEGQIFTFEVNEDRYKLAVEDFKDSSIIKVHNRNVCSDGFDPSTFGRADAIFLDLPSPWLVVPFCMKAYRRDKLVRFCSFSPCIEQVQKTCEKLREFNFAEISTVECVPREYKVVNLSTPLQDFGGKGVAAVPISAAKRRRVAENNDEMENKQQKETFKTTAIGQNECYLSYVADPLEQPTHTGYLTFASLLPCNSEKIR